MNKKFKRVVSLTLGVAISASSLSLLISGCTKSSNKVDALVIMSEEVEGLFNPFYATSGADMEVVGMTQIGMLTSEYDDTEKSAVLAYGEDEACVALDFASSYSATETGDSSTAEGVTTYTFVLKNNLYFSDGKPLTMNDVLFNLYEYLDPVYSGSTTIYSTDIIGLTQYRTQENRSESGTLDDDISKEAATMADSRIQELINLYINTSRKLNGSTTTSYAVSEEEMKEAINSATLSSGYKEAVSSDTSKVTTANLLADYNLALQYYKEELESDFDGAYESYAESDPYKSYKQDGKLVFDEITCFMYMEGFVEIEYNKKTLANGKTTDDKSSIKRVMENYNTATVVDKQSAIEYVYNNMVESHLDMILQYTSTAGKLTTEYSSNAKSVILGTSGGDLTYDKIEGINSLGHDTTISEVTVNGTTYKVAHEYNEDGTVANDDEYAVLQIKINGVDPKAKWNFSFTVAPAHYYAPNQTIDIKNHKYGVVWGSYDFQKNVIQSSDRVGLPVGAGPYKATDSSGSDNPKASGFNSNNIIYFKANENFLLGKPATEKINYQVVSANNALSALQNGSVHYVTPQYTKQNYSTIKNIESSGYTMLSSKQLGYGYVGINASKVTDLNLRKAIMSAMNASLALEYYQGGTCEIIYWPMSQVSWAYPKDAQGNYSMDNGHDYMTWEGDSAAMDKIKNYMAAAGVAEGDSSLSIKFTVAGSNLNDHPTYAVFAKAADLLNACGWDIEVQPDTQALTKLSTGALTVWAAAWGSTVDPDMYQVYHKNSTATSTNAWGYSAIKNSSTRTEEQTILNDLSALIDDAREIEDQTKRADIYEDAMSLVLDLAIEMPIYQRNVMYVYNSNVIDSSSLPTSAEINPYTSPLSKIWEVKLK